MKIENIGFGGSCHWCTEAVFQSLKGVVKVEQGWIAAEEAPDFHEAVIVHYQPELIPFDILIEVHLLTHNSTSDHSMRKKYRSAIYTFSPSQKERAEEVLQKLQPDFTEPLITKTYTFMEFRTSEETFQNYYAKNPGKPFCKSYISPKLKLVFDRFKEHASSKENMHK